MGPLICSAWGRSIFEVLGPPSLCLSPGEAGSWAVSPAPSAPGPALSDSPSRLRRRLSAKPLPDTLRVAPGAAHPPPHRASSSAGAASELRPGHAAPSPRIRHPSPSELLPGQCVRTLQPFRELGTLSVLCSCSVRTLLS